VANAKKRPLRYRGLSDEKIRLLAPVARFLRVVIRSAVRHMMNDTHPGS
jgi:hypothetical protein